MSIFGDGFASGERDFLREWQRMAELLMWMPGLETCKLAMGDALAATCLPAHETRAGRLVTDIHDHVSNYNMVQSGLGS